MERSLSANLQRPKIHEQLPLATCSSLKTVVDWFSQLAATRKRLLIASRNLQQPENVCRLVLATCSNLKTVVVTFLQLCGCSDYMNDCFMSEMNYLF